MRVGPGMRMMPRMHARILFAFLCSFVTACDLSAVPEDSTPADTQSLASAPSPGVVTAGGRDLIFQHVPSTAGVATGGTLSGGRWSPSTTGQQLEIPLSLVDGDRIDAVTIDGWFAAGTVIDLLRVDGGALGAVALGTANVQSVFANGHLTWGLVAPHAAGASDETVGTANAAYYVRMTSSANLGTLGPITVQTSHAHPAPGA